jgi:hypothetical protein
MEKAANFKSGFALICSKPCTTHKVNTNQITRDFSAHIKNKPKYGDHKIPTKNMPKYGVIDIGIGSSVKLSLSLSLSLDANQPSISM